MEGVAQAAAGDRHSCAVLTVGEVRCWVDNSHGQLGDGSTTEAVTAYRTGPDPG